MESIDAFIDRLPKVELHLHLVGSDLPPRACRWVAGLTEALDIAACSARRDHDVQMAYVFDIASEFGAPAARATLEHALSCPPEALTGHGISCLDDPALVAWLRERQVSLEVCVCTRQVPSWPRTRSPRGCFVTLPADVRHHADGGVPAGGLGAGAGPGTAGRAGGWVPGGVSAGRGSVFRDRGHKPPRNGW